MLAVPMAKAYDALPQVDADFGAIEKMRIEREAVARKETVEVNSYVKAIERCATKDEFIDAADKMSVYVIGKAKFPEGMKIKAMVKRIAEAYDSLPKQRYRCEATRTNNGVCYTPGKDAELAYQSLLNEVDKYSRIVVGDYRTVTYKAF